MNIRIRYVKKGIDIVKVKLFVICIFGIILTACNGTSVCFLTSNNSSTNSISIPNKTSKIGNVILSYLEYFDENKTTLVKENWIKEEYGCEICFQDISGDEVPEMLVKSDDIDAQHHPQIIVFSKDSNSISCVRLSNFLLKETENFRFDIYQEGTKREIVITQFNKMDSNYFLTQSKSDTYDESKILKTDYVNSISISVDYLYDKDGTLSSWGGYYFESIKSPSQQLFFDAVKNYIFKWEWQYIGRMRDEEGKNPPEYPNRIYAENFVKECEVYKNPETGLYELYIIGRDYERLLGETFEYPQSNEVGHGYIVPKEVFEQHYSEFFAQRQKVALGPIYQSGYLDINDIDYERIVQEALKVFE